MSVTVTTDRITISDEEVSLADLKYYADRVGQSRRVTVLDNKFYLIDVDIYIINNGALVDSNKHLEIKAQYLQIEKGSKLQLGKKRDDGSTYDGCTLIVTNPRSIYGFGSTTTTNSGDLLLYDSKIDIWCFWSFFEGDNLVEIIDCSIRGYGRIAGSKSILKNINFRYSHGTYGILSPKGEILEMTNLNTHEVLEVTGRKCATYHYPAISGDLNIYFGEYSGYEHLSYILNSPGHNRLEFRGSNILSGYNLLRQSNNVDFYHSFMFNPRILDIDGNVIPEANILLKDKNGNIVINELTTIDGEIESWVPYYCDIADGVKEILTPHTLEVRTPTITMHMIIHIDRNLFKFPITMQKILEQDLPSNVDYDKIQAMITESTNTLLDKIDTVEEKVVSGNSDISSIIITLGEEVEENQTIIESKTGNTRLIL